MKRILVLCFLTIILLFSGCIEQFSVRKTGAPEEQGGQKSLRLMMEEAKTRIVLMNAALIKPMKSKSARLAMNTRKTNVQKLKNRQSLFQHLTI